MSGPTASFSHSPSDRIPLLRERSYSLKGHSLTKHRHVSLARRRRVAVLLRPVG